MFKANYLKTVSKVLHVPLTAVRRYVDQIKGREDGAEPIPPNFRYATIKAEPRQQIEQVTTIEKAPLSETVDNEVPVRKIDELHAKWNAAGSPDEREKTLEEIHKAGHQLGEAVGWLELGKNDPDFANDVAAAVVNRTPKFVGKNNARFSTYAYSIAKNQATEWKRKRARYKKRFPDHDGELEEYGSNDDLLSADARLLRFHLLHGLNKIEKVLFNLMCEGRGTVEIAQTLKIHPRAAESRIRRLRDKLRKKVKPQ